MSFILNIFLNNISPIIVLVILGIVLGKKFPLDTFTLSKLNFYLFIPAFLFYQVYTTDLEVSYLWICFFTFILMILAGLICVLISKLGRFPQGITNAFFNSVLFFNSGNFGLPLITLIFMGTPWFNQAVTAQIMVLLVQNTMMNTFGFISADNGKRHWKESIKGILKMPQIYAAVFALCFKFLPFRLEPLFFWPAVNYLRMALIPMALTLLGIQLGRTRFHLGDYRIYLASAVRLFLIPFIAYLLINIFGFTGVVAQTVFISSGCPTAVTTALIALERGNEPDFAAQVVLTTTLFCVITLVILISLSGKLFPVM